MHMETTLPSATGSGGAKERPPQGPDHHHRPGNLANGMLGPVVPFGIRGAIWYQGESNASRAWQYRTLLPMMIQDWRAWWGNGDFPFGIVQLADFHAEESAPADTEWPHLRDAQLHTARTVPNCGLAVAIDLGETNDIHPRNKQEVGRRLSRWALADVYGTLDVGAGPEYLDHRIEGDKVAITFGQVGEGLMVMHGGELSEFTIAGEDQVWHPAEANIEGEDTVVVSADAVPAPKAVRYGWSNNPVRPNLANSLRLPASPFRTDEWAGPTRDEL